MNTGFKWVERRNLWFLVSAVLIGISILSLAVQGLNLGIDFQGGILVRVQFEEPQTTAAVRQGLNAQTVDGVVQQVGDEAQGTEFNLRLPEMSDPDRQAVLDRLAESVGPFEVLSVDNVSPVIGAELRQAALWAVLVATIGMLLYITLRFEWRFALAAVVALIHDVLITLGFYSVFQLTVDVSFVAAVLTVYGYSINDTIIVFDRIRENLNRRRKESLTELLDASVDQVLARSINTSLTTLLAVTAVFLLGGVTIKGLALALMVGIIAGTYSSIFIATPIYSLLTGESDGIRQAAARTRA